MNQIGRLEKDHSNEVILPVKSGNVEVKNGNLSRDEEFGAATVAFQAGSGEDHLPRTFDGKKSQGSIIVGIGEAKALDEHGLIESIRRAVRYAVVKGITSLTFYYRELKQYASSLSDYALGRLVGEQATVAAYEFDLYKVKKQHKVTRINIFGADSKDTGRGISDGVIIGQETNFARDLINMPPRDLTPENFARAAERQVEGTKATIKVYTLSEIKKMNMGLLERVASGSKKEPRFVVVEYMGAGQGVAPTVLMGKGITFDTGGVNVKTNAPDMARMHYDMAGGAAVLAAVTALARMGAEANVVGIVPMAENGIGPDSLYPSDIVKAGENESVLIQDTDAEGRLVLADAATYVAQNYKNAESVVSVATLTGSATTSVGKGITEVLTTNRSIRDQVEEISDTTSAKVASVTLTKKRDKQIEQQLKGEGEKKGATIGHILGRDEGAGAIVGKVFISHFLGDELRDRHVHLDIAPSAANSPDSHLSGVASGEPVSLLIGYVERRQGVKK